MTGYHGSRRHLIGSVVMTAVMVLLPLQVLAQAAAPETPIASCGLPTSRGGSALCCLCGLIARIEALAVAFAPAGYSWMAPMVIDMVGILFAAQFFLLLARIVINPSQALEGYKAVLGQMLFAIGVVAVLRAVDGNAPWLWTNAVEPVFQLGGRLASAVLDFIPTLNVAGGVAMTPPGAYTAPGGLAIGASQPYARLWGGVETTLSPIFAAVGANASAGGMISGLFFAYIILALPYVLVGVVFLAFLIQVMWFMMVLTVALPIALMMSMLQTTRVYLYNIIKTMISRVMTLFFCAWAMAFTGFIIAQYMSVLTRQSGGPMSTFGEVGQFVWNAAVRTITLDFGTRTTTASDALLLTSGYWALLILGGASVMLHLQAPRLASEVTGSSDSATTATAVTGVFSSVVARGIGMMYKGGRSAVKAAPKLAGSAMGAGAGLLGRFRANRGE